MICLLHITCHILGSFSCRVLVFVVLEKLRNIFIGDIHKTWSGHIDDKTAKQFLPLNLMPGTRRQLKYNVQPDWSNQIIIVYLIGQFTREVISEMIYHFTGIIFSHGFVTLISTHIICTKEKYQMVKAWFRILNSCNLVGERKFDFKIIKIREMYQQRSRICFFGIFFLRGFIFFSLGEQSSSSQHDGEQYLLL